MPIIGTYRWLSSSNCSPHEQQHAAQASFCLQLKLATKPSFLSGAALFHAGGSLDKKDPSSVSSTMSNDICQSPGSLTTSVCPKPLKSSSSEIAVGVT